MDKDKYIGRLLDNRYEILEVIGTGGMAVVYKARCHRLNRLVAIKILKDDLSQDSEFRRRFHTESQAVAMLSHPNIMSVYDVSTTDEADYIVMELIDGITLKQYMEKKGVLNWKETLHFAMLIAKALEHAHSRGIVHRDIKPHNVMVLKNGSVKVTDFGIARIMSKSNTLTKEALGSVHYISPEQAKGGRVDNRSDLYSLAVVMYEMMTGRPPYDGESPVSVAIQHINGGAPMPSTLNPNIPGGLEQIIMKTMDVDPARRYDSATAMLWDLEAFRQNPGMLFTFVPPAAEAAARKAPQRTQAERAAMKNQNPVRKSTTSREHERRQTPADPAQARRREAERRERQAKEADRMRLVTIAVVACSLVAVAAIVFFLVMLLGGGAGNNVTLHAAPRLIGKDYATLDRESYSQFQIVLEGYEYSSEYAQGVIMEQDPREGTQLAPGSQIKVTVSSGEEQEDLPNMEDLTGTTQKAAENWLNALKAELVILPKTENHDTLKEGLVTRTEPAVGQPLKRGQTVVLWISSGPEKREEYVPNVVGLTLDRAITTLQASGFDNYEVLREESTKDKDEVLRLSVEVRKKLDVTTNIIIYVSEGFVKEKVPNVVGRTYEAAVKELNYLGFKDISQDVKESTQPAGTVLEQSAKAGDEYDTKTAIVLTISEGVVRKVVPKVTGMDFESAKAALNKAGFDHVVSREVESSQPKGTVLTQSHQPDSKASSTEQIVLEISSGPMVVKPVNIPLPTDLTAEYHLTIMHQGQTVADMTIQPGTPGITVQFTGRGSSDYEVYIDGVIYTTGRVNFDT